MSDIKAAMEKAGIEAADEIDRLRDRVKALEEALRPFAETTDFRALSLTCTQSDLRRARAALGTKP